ncbi:hypothetical protein ACIQXW_08795 [Lysinibacillus sp. NPDC097162]|uniref:hypothetical protein n=1 Tax=unclassified Lysinibacillus TaxID=2636778 RepID=UPI003812C91A
MKKFVLMAVLSLVAIMAAACGNEVSKSGNTSLPSSETKKEESSPEKESEIKDEAKKDEIEQEAAAPVVTVNYARNYLEDIPSLTEEQLTLDKQSYNFISTNADLFPALSKDAIQKTKKLADDKITSKHLNKNVKPYLEQMVTFAGDIIQIQEETLDDGTPVSIILIEDMDFNAIFAIGYHSTEFLEGDFVEIWGLPLGPYNYENIDGGTTLAQAIATSYIE